MIFNADLNMLLMKLDKRLDKLSESSGKKFKRLERQSGEPIYCNPPPGVPKWAIDSSSIENHHDSASDVLEDGQVMEPMDPLSESLQLYHEATDQSNTAVPSESDSDFSIELESV